MTSADAKDLQDIKVRLNKEAIASEYKRIKMFIGALGLGFLIMGHLFFVMEGVVSFFQNPNTPKLVIGWILAFILYETLALLIVRSYLQKKKNLPEARLVQSRSL